MNKRIILYSVIPLMVLLVVSSVMAVTISLAGDKDKIERAIKHDKIYVEIDGKIIEPESLSFGTVITKEEEEMGNSIVRPVRPLGELKLIGENKYGKEITYLVRWGEHKKDSLIKMGDEITFKAKATILVKEFWGYAKKTGVIEVKFDKDKKLATVKSVYGDLDFKVEDIPAKIDFQ